ncbi:PIG-L deacetylase family protein [Vreelandella sp. EE22]
MREAWYVPYHAGALQGQRVLVLAPHPDDEVFGCGGALTQLAAQGATIQVIIATQGPQAALRLEESTQAAALLGYPTPLNWDFADRGLEQAREALAERLWQTLEEFQADLLLAPSSWEMHPDHRAACDAALTAAARYSGRQALTVALYEIGVPLSVNHLVDISPVAEQKAQAMQCFASQLAEQRYAEQIGGLNRYRSYTLGLAVTQAEAFHVLKPGEEHAEVVLPSVQDQALWRCEAALLQAQQDHAESVGALRRELAQAQEAAQAASRERLNEHQEQTQELAHELAQELKALEQAYQALSAQAAETQAALENSEHARRGAEQMLETIYATRGWRWLSRLKSLSGRG